MRTFTNLRQDSASYCNIATTDSTAMAIVDKNVNDSIRTICNLQGGKLRFLESTSTMVTVADQETYQIPNKYRKLIDMYVYSGSGGSSDIIYMPEMVFDPTKWKLILAYKLGTQDTPYFTYIENRTYKIQPIPSTSGKLITLRGRLDTKDLLIADITTARVVSITNGATAMVIDTVSATADWVGRYIRITQTNAAGGGDGNWYEIGTYTSATAIGLTKPYEGTTLSGATAACVVGQVSVIPQAYDIGIVYRATYLYWLQQGDINRAKVYALLYDGGNEMGLSKEYGGIMGQMLVTEGEVEEGSYIPAFGSSSNMVQTAPYYWANQLGSGF